ncbi:MAG: DNA-3-methyladenine glycosylase 2 family protein [Proteobacteria bacterium]|nr:DNA-3-methyladenine glycosylase 2 family protein [Pseudomonadota bacterium]
MGTYVLTPRRSGFEFLADAIISQQLSKSAADTIIRRFRDCFSSGRVTPKSFLSLPPDKILKSGLSSRKYECLVELAKAIENRELRLSDLSEKDDETIRAGLKRIKGIGDWTVDMFLLFGLAKLDVLPVHDLALRRIISNIYGCSPNETDRIEHIAEHWKPFRGVACWYLYKYGNMKTEQGAGANRP